MKKIWALAVLPVLITACGGGGGGGGGGASVSAAPSPSTGSPAAPVPGPVAPTPGSGAPASSPTPPAPAPVQVPSTPTGLAVAYAPKQYALTWAPSVGATEYEIFEDVDGPGPSAGARVGPAVTATALAVDLPLLHRRVNATYSVRACNSAGCSAFSANVQPDLRQAIGYFKASNTETNDMFGWSVALSDDGSTLAVGALSEASDADGINGNQANNGQNLAGAVYVFSRVNGSWLQEAYVKASTSRTTAGFGGSVALSSDGNTMAVGAPFETSDADGIGGDETDASLSNAGAAYVFTRTGGGWTQQAYIKSPASETLERFAYQLALSGDGNTLAIGAAGSTSVAATNKSGKVHLLTRTGAVWAYAAHLQAMSADAGDSFGQALALSRDGGTLVVGAPGESSAASGVNGNSADNSLGASGAAYVFRGVGPSWTQQAYLKPSNPMLNAAFGFSVAVASDGKTVAVGAMGERSSSTGINGSQTDAGSGWAEAGAAYVFVENLGMWAQQAYVKASNTDPSDRFGYSVALSADGNLLVVGAPQEMSNATAIDGDQTDNSRTAGAAYLFSRTGSVWSQQAYVKSSNLQSWNFGWSVGLAADGKTLGVGDFRERSNATGIGGDQTNGAASTSGAVYLY